MLSTKAATSGPVCRLCFAMVLAAGLPGCGSGNNQLLPVEGKVLLGDKLLATDSHLQGYVTLYPDKAKGNKSLEIPLGTIDSEGRFKIFTRINPGAAPGWYKVTVSAAPVVDPKNPYLKKTGWLMPERYIDQDKSKLTLEVVANPAAGAYDLKLDPK
jgi:hypothetical protein